MRRVLGTGRVAPGRGDGMWHSRCVAATVIDNPILNSPFAEPTRHWVLDENGIPTGVAADGRRRSEYIVPVPPPRHRVNKQAELGLEDAYGERKPKLTPHQMKKAIKRRDAGEPVREIARSYNVSHGTISRLAA